MQRNNKGVDLSYYMKKQTTMTLTIDFILLMATNDFRGCFMSSNKIGLFEWKHFTISAFIIINDLTSALLQVKFIKITVL